jgi:hypothetical protein
MIEAIKMEILDQIEKINGFDAYFVIDSAQNVLEKKIPDYLTNLNLKNIILNVHQLDMDVDSFGKIEKRLLLAEKGVIYVTTINKNFLFILAGYKDEVDITELDHVVEQIKQNVH